MTEAIYISTSLNQIEERSLAFLELLFQQKKEQHSQKVHSVIWILEI